ncbi:hypothetical protein ACHAXH_001518 [Discostella pseudostelligera]
MKRLVSIAVELGPVTCEYMIDFHFRPWLRRSLSLSLVDAEADNAEEVVEEERIQKHEMERSLSSRLRSSLTKLGPTFIKVGQQLSIRPDLISPTALFELQKLCDAVPPFDDEIAMKVLAQELASSMRKRRRDVSNLMDDKEEVEHTILQVFEEMPTLIASASLGQVYKAKLRSLHNNNNDEAASKQVAIKIQRPDVLEVVTLDLFLLVSYGKFVDKLFSIITNQIPYHEMFLNTFANGAYMELNYINEADNQTFFRNELHSRFHGNTNTNKKHSSSSRLLQLFQNRHRVRGRTHAEKVMVPKVYNEYTTERILVSEWIDGIPLARAPPEQIRKLIPIGVELFLCQLLDIGRFHADPHPGNLYVTTSKADGVTPILCLLDFGLIAHVSESERSNMTQAIVNLLQGDYDTLISRDAKELGFLPHELDVTELKPVLKKILKEGLVDAGSSMHDRKRNLMAISNELNDVFFRYPFSVPPFFALVTRGLGLLEGIALVGDPSFDIFQASYPFAKRKAMESFTVTDYGKISLNLLSLRRASTQVKG